MDQEKNERTQNTNIRNERGSFIINLTDIQRLIREYYEQLDDNNSTTKVK